jgi:hypothetical protein
MFDLAVRLVQRTTLMLRPNTAQCSLERRAAEARKPVLVRLLEAFRRR